MRIQIKPLYLCGLAFFFLLLFLCPSVTFAAEEYSKAPVCINDLTPVKDVYALVKDDEIFISTSFLERQFYYLITEAQGPDGPIVIVHTKPFPFIFGPDNFQEAISRSVASSITTNEAAANFLLSWIRCISYVDEITSSDMNAIAYTLPGTYMVQINGPLFEMQRRLFSQKELTTRYLLTLLHEASHNALQFAGLNAILSTSDQQLIAELTALRAAEQMNAPPTVIAEYQNRVATQLRASGLLHLH